MGTLLLTFVVAIGSAQAQAASPQQTKPKSPEELAVERVQKLVVSSIDGSLPQRTLQPWLKEVFGPSAKTTFELGFCGEMMGGPHVDRSRDTTCVDAAVTLAQGRVLHLVFVTPIPKGDARPVPPTFSYGVVMEGGASTRWIKSLGEASRIR